MAVFWNHDHISDQTKPNQTSPSGILHFASHSLRAYHKKFQVSRSNGSRDNGSGKFKIWKLSILGFFEKGPPEPPQKVKKWFQWYFWLSGTHMGSQKNFRRFSGRGVRKCVQVDWTAPFLLYNCLYLSGKRMTRLIARNRKVNQNPSINDKPH